MPRVELSVRSRSDLRRRPSIVTLLVAATLSLSPALAAPSWIPLAAPGAPTISGFEQPSVIGPASPFADTPAAIADLPNGSAARFSANWTNVTSSTGDPPSFFAPRLGATFAYAAVDRLGLLFGGVNSSDGKLENETWSYAGASWARLDISVSPSARAFSSMAYDPQAGVVVLFGGVDAKGALLNDTWTYYAGKWTPHQVPGPPPRSNASFAWDPSESMVTLFGGESVAGELNDTWDWNGNSWSNVTNPGTANPPALEGAGFSSDPNGSGAILFGGWNGTACTNQTWYRAGNSWSLLDTSGAPPARCDAATSEDSESDVLVVLGGRDAHSGGGSLNDTWELSGAIWTRVSVPSAPSPRFGAGLIDCLRCASLALYGGAGPSPTDDTWTFTDFKLQISAFPAGGDAPLNVTLNATLLDGVGPFEYGWNLGDGSESTAPSLTHVYTEPGTYAVTLNVSESTGLGASGILRILVDPGLQVRATATPRQGVAPLPVSFSGSAAGGSGPYRYLWNFGDGTTSTSANVTHVYTESGNFSAVFQATDRFSHSVDAVVQIAVISPLVAGFTTSVSAGEAPLSVEFTADVVGGVGPYTYNWSFGNGAYGVGVAVAAEYTARGNFTARLSVSDSSGWTADASAVITVAPPLGAGLEYSPTSGPSPLTVQLVSDPTGGEPPYSFQWSFGDGGQSDLVRPSHTYAFAGDWNVSLTVRDAWNYSVEAGGVVSVSPPVPALFVSLGASVLSGRAPLNVSFVAVVQGGTGVFTENWSFGDGSTGGGLRASHSYDRSGIYQVQFTATDSASQTGRANLTIVVSSAPSANGPVSLPWILWPVLGSAAAAAVLMGLWRVARRSRRHTGASIE